MKWAGGCSKIGFGDELLFREGVRDGAVDVEGLRGVYRGFAFGFGGACGW